MSEGNRNKEWARRSIPALWAQGDKGPGAFVSALAGTFDESEEARYRSAMMRYPYGPAMRQACAYLDARTFPAADDDARLRALGQNFQLRRFPTESGASYEERLGLAWDLHGQGGTAIAVRKNLEAFGFPQIEILEECYSGLLPEGAEYHWSFVVVLGPNYGSLPIGGMFLGSFVLGSPATGYLGLGTFSAAQVDDVVRLILEGRQAHDCPIRVVFRFGDAPVLGLISLGSFVLGGSIGSGVAIREIQGRHMLGSWYLGTTTFAGFGV